ncbi:MAG: PaaI family thioesterase [Syntrophomonas sp.]
MNQSEVENRGLDKDIFDIVRNIYINQRCHQTMGFKLTYLGNGVAGMEMVPDPIFSTRGGRVHGGTIASLADTVMGAAAATIGYGQIYRTVEMKLNYLAPVFEEAVLTAEGRVVHPGKSLAVVEANLFNNEGKLVARSMGTFFSDTKSIAGLDNISLHSN